MVMATYSWNKRAEYLWGNDEIWPGTLDRSNTIWEVDLIEVASVKAWRLLRTKTHSTT